MKRKRSNFLPPAVPPPGPPRQRAGGGGALGFAQRAAAPSRVCSAVLAGSLRSPIFPDRLCRYIEKISIYRLRQSTIYLVYSIVKFSRTTQPCCLCHYYPASDVCPVLCIMLTFPSRNNLACPRSLRRTRLLACSSHGGRGSRRHLSGCVPRRSPA